jgi:glycolate oxidase FAD binding subunit
MMQQPSTIEELQEIVRQSPRVHVRGGGTKSALSSGAGVSMEKLTGVIEYDPSEFTFTARGGTPVREVETLLSGSGQYLPFDPVWVDQGATLGGTIASGLSGSGRFRYGGVRDFILGLQFVTGDGESHAGGGRVVKNAAGFDFPKLMVGSRGSMGIITQVTFKVFPRPQRYATVRVKVTSPLEGSALLQKLARSSLELACLDYQPPGEVVMRVGGLASALARRVERITELVALPVEVLLDEEEQGVWRAAREFSWMPTEDTLLKIPLLAGQIVSLEAMLSSIGLASTPRRYSVAGNVCWLAWPADRGPADLVAILSKLDSRAMAIRGKPWGVLGSVRDAEFQKRLAQILDPAGKLVCRY